jgi:hypothetical protein
MDQHLDDLQMAALIAGEADAAAEGHVATCPACAAERTRLAAAIGGWRADLQLSSERPAAFWEQQRRAIEARRTAGEAKRGLGMLSGILRGSRGAMRGTQSSASAAERWSPTRWAFAGVAAAAVLAAIVALGVVLGPEPPATVIASATPRPSGIASARDGAAARDASTADDALLTAVEGALARRAPAALEPAEALLHELVRARTDGGAS